MTSRAGVAAAAALTLAAAGGLAALGQSGPAAATARPYPTVTADRLRTPPTATG